METKYKVGSLCYTRAALMSLFFWLLLGGFVFTVMENVVPTLFPLILRSNGASNEAIAFLVSSIFMIVNAVSNPIISYKSDRYRSKWGRRRPFIILTTPFVVLLLAVIPYSPEITNTMNSTNWIAAILKFSPVMPILLVSGILVTLYQIFNMFVASVYYYLVPDVVPESFIGRFYALFRMAGFFAGFVFNYFLFKNASTYMHEIFIGIAIVYGFFIILMCLKVKEGEYPPVEKNEKRTDWIGGVRTYVKECFSHPMYLLIFLVYTLLTIGMASDIFYVFFYKDNLGLTMEQIGKINACVGLTGAIVALPLGIILDRFGSHKSLIGGFVCASILKGCGFLFAANYFTAFLFAILSYIPVAMVLLSIVKWLVDLFPREKYGQYSSYAVMASSVASAVCSPLCGHFFDYIKGYQYVWIWPVFFYLAGGIVTFIVYRIWLALGGAEGYKAPGKTVFPEEGLKIHLLPKGHMPIVLLGYMRT